MPRATNLLTWLLFILAACAAAYALYVHLVVISLPNPQEYRECAIVLSTDLLLHGENPYALANQPVYTNIYGIGYQLLMAPIAKVFGCTLPVHRAVAAVFVWGSCALVFAALAHAGVGRRLSFAAAAMLYCDLAIRAAPTMRPIALPLTVLARPDAMALFLFLISVIVPWWKQFSRRSLIISAAAAILAFFTKPYFVLGMPIVAGYLLILGPRRKGLIYGASVGAALIALLVGATAVMQCYTANVVTGNRSATGQMIASHLLAQAGRFIGERPGILLIVIIAAVTFVAQKRWKPLSPVSPLAYFGFAAACAAAVLFSKLGWYGGNSILYFIHLLAPFLLLTAFVAIAQLRMRWLLLLPMIDLLLLPLSAAPVPQRFDGVWDAWSELIAQNKSIYAPPPLACMLAEHHRPLYNGGLSDSFLYSMKGSIYPSGATLRRRYEQFTDEIAQKVRRRQFGAIVLPYDQDKPEFTFVPTELLSQFYRPAGKLELPMSWQSGWIGIVWEPIPAAAGTPASSQRSSP